MSKSALAKPGSDIAELAEVGHVPQREDPVQCAEIISRFMASLARKEAIS